MTNLFSKPPKNLRNILNSLDLVDCLQTLIGKPFKLSGQPRTDGSNARKLITECLSEYSSCEVANDESYAIIPPRKKGVPRLLLELIDTFIVTSGENYNLQVWNRYPNSQSVLVEYSNGKCIRCCDIRFVFLKVNAQSSIIDSIIVLTPSYIEKKFGTFGKPTIKHQIIIPPQKRAEIKGNILLGKDTKTMIDFCRKSYKKPSEKMTEFPIESKPFSIEILFKSVAQNLVGVRLQGNDTKTRGQNLERKVMSLLGYNSRLVGGYPDIPNQLLEVKLQDSATIDLGKFSPETDAVIFSDFTTKDIRYLIALTNHQSRVIESVVLVSGAELGKVFTYVSATSFKCQRMIPMSFFEKYRGKAVFNP